MDVPIGTSWQIQLKDACSAVMLVLTSITLAQMKYRTCVAVAEL